MAKWSPNDPAYREVRVPGIYAVLEWDAPVVVGAETSVLAGLGVFREHDLRFRVPSGDLVQDPETGNYYPSTHLEVPIRAWFKTPNTVASVRWSTYMQNMVGIDREFVLLQGRLTAPSMLPDAIRSGMKADMTLGHDEGEFMLGAIVPEVLDVSYYRDILGQEIIGAWVRK